VFLITGCEGQPAADSKATGDAAMRKSAAKASESGTASSKEFGIGSAAPPMDTSIGSVTVMGSSAK